MLFLVKCLDRFYLNNECGFYMTIQNTSSNSLVIQLQQLYENSDPLSTRAEKEKELELFPESVSTLMYNCIDYFVAPVVHFCQKNLTRKDELNGPHALVADRVISQATAVPQEYWTTRSGNTIQRIVSILKEKSVLSNISQEKWQERLSLKANKESLKTGYAMGKLITMSGAETDKEISVIALSILGILRNAVQKSKLDVEKSLESIKQDSVQRLKGANEYICGINAKICECAREKNSEVILEQFLDNTLNEQRNLYNSVQNAYENAGEYYNRIDDCTRSLNALNAFEEKEFANKDIKLYRQITLKKKDEILNIISSIKASLEPTFARILVQDTSFNDYDIMTVCLSEEKKAYIPRLGEITYESKEDCSKAVSSFINNALNHEGRIVEVTIWRNSSKSEQQQGSVLFEELDENGEPQPQVNESSPTIEIDPEKN